MLANSAGRGQIIWPIAVKLFRSVMLQQRPRFTGWRVIPERPVLPWDDSDRPPQINFGRVDLPMIAAYTTPDNFALVALQIRPILPSNNRLPSYSNPSVSKQPAVVHHLMPPPATFFTITGRTLDSGGAALATCAVDLFETLTDIRTGSTTSNGDGYFYFKAERGKTYYMVAYKAGGTDVAGTTVNTLVVS